MGFLDLLSGKKDSSSSGAKPPAPSSQGAPAPQPPLPGSAPSAPKPPMPGGELADSLGGNADDASKAPAPKIQNPDPKAIFTAMHNENPPPEFKPDDLNLPKFDLPNFPKNYPELNFDIPAYGKQPGSQTVAPAPVPSASDDSTPEVSSGTSSASGSVAPTAPVSAPSESDDSLSTAMPAITPIREDGSFGEDSGSSSSSAPEVAPAAQSSTTSTSEPQKRPVSESTFAPRKNYLDVAERELNDEKERIHAPMNEPGTDSRRIGNVEKVVERRTRIPKEPVFIEINDYKRVLDGVDEARRDANESQEMILKLEEFNDKKHSEFEKWKKIFENINTKLKFIDKTMFEQE